MKKIRTLLRKFCFLIINKSIQYRPFMVLFNYFYERAPYQISVYLFRHVIFPNKPFNWTIKLYNNRKVITPIHNKDNPDTLYFGLIYKLHDRAQNILESILVGYYPDNSVWIDCGANLGLRSIAALSRKLNVYMIEPNEETNAINLERCKLNNFTNYTILPLGVSDTDTEKKFYFNKSSFFSSIYKDNINEKDIKGTAILQFKKIDTIFSGLIHSKIHTFIKIDVEGHEKEVIDGAENIINSLSPTLLIEINNKGEHIESIFEKMRQKGYKIYKTTQKNKK